MTWSAVLVLGSCVSKSSKPVAAPPAVAVVGHEQLIRLSVEQSGIKPAVAFAAQGQPEKALGPLIGVHNLVADGSFEGQFGPAPSYVWLASLGVQVENQLMLGAPRSRRVRIDDAGKPREIEQSIRLKLFTHYALAADVTTSAGLKSGVMDVTAYASDHDPLISAADRQKPRSTLVRSPVAASQAMREVRLEFDTADHPWTILSVGVDGTSQGQWLRVDNISLIELPNVVEDGSFERGGKSWFSSAGARVSTTDQRSGRSAMLVPATGDWNATNQWLHVVKHTKYRVSAWVRPSSSLTSYVSIRGNPQETSFDVIAQSVVGPAPAIVKGAPSAYRHVTFDFDSGDNSTVLLYAGFFGKGASVLEVDDVSVTLAADVNASVDWSAPAGTDFMRSLRADDGSTFLYHSSDQTGKSIAIGRDRHGVIHRLETKTVRTSQAFNVFRNFFENDKPTLAIGIGMTTAGFADLRIDNGPAGRQGLELVKDAPAANAKTTHVRAEYWTGCTKTGAPTCHHSYFDGQLDLQHDTVTWSKNRPPSLVSLDPPGLAAGDYFQPLFNLETEETDALFATGIAWFDAHHWYDHSDEDFARVEQELTTKGTITAIKWIAKAERALVDAAGVIIGEELGGPYGAWKGYGLSEAINNAILDPATDWLIDTLSDDKKFCREFPGSYSCQLLQEKTYSSGN